MNIGEDKNKEPLHLMLMNSSPGILDGDDYEIKIEVEKQCSLQLHTQAYQRLFNMKVGAAQQMNIYLQDGATFCYLPHPSVPHAHSTFTSFNNFYLGQNCKFIFGEILTCGRKLNGEIFSFTKYHSVSKIFINNKLVIKENLLMQPSLNNVQGMGQLEGYTHQASMIYLQEEVNIKDIQQRLIEIMLIEKNIVAGITAASVNGLIIRLLGNGAEPLYDLIKKINELLNNTNTNKSAETF